MVAWLCEEQCWKLNPCLSPLTWTCSPTLAHSDSWRWHWTRYPCRPRRSPIAPGRQVALTRRARPEWEGRGRVPLKIHSSQNPEIIPLEWFDPEWLDNYVFWQKMNHFKGIVEKWTTVIRFMIWFDFIWKLNHNRGTPRHLDSGSISQLSPAE